MEYLAEYDSPLGKIILSADDTGLTGLWFDGQKYSDIYLNPNAEKKELPIFTKAFKWLDVYFSGKEPDFSIPIHFIGTEFQCEVWKILTEIPYGKTMTYGEISEIIAKRKGISKMSAQAVGGAVGRNRISIIVPCHRVIGSNKNLTGYAAGIKRKTQLLAMENSL